MSKRLRSAKIALLIAGIIPLICGCTAPGTIVGAMVDSHKAHSSSATQQDVDKVPHGRMIQITCTDGGTVSGKNRGIIRHSDSLDAQQPATAQTTDVSAQQGNEFHVSKWRVLMASSSNLVVDSAGSCREIPLQYIQSVYVAPVRTYYWALGMGLGAVVDAVIINAIFINVRRHPPHGSPLREGPM